MFLARLLSAPLYRAGQFASQLSARLTPEDHALIARTLPAPLLALFHHMSPGDQAHSLRVLRALQAAGWDRPELLQAALLHDVGKTVAPPTLWGRALVVLARWLAPDTFGNRGLAPAATRRRGGGSPSGWRRPFVVAEQHPAWGATLAARAGAAPLTVALIRHHQSTTVGMQDATAARLLEHLQKADASN
ncbi:MAG: HD domain-containing protein [Chloroflexi bacterium]|nr:HD domain-containing protein [Chloroflexota bacterium]